MQDSLKSEGIFFFSFSLSLKSKQKLVCCKRITYKNNIHRGSLWESGKRQIAIAFSHSYLEKQTTETALLSRER